MKRAFFLIALLLIALPFVSAGDFLNTGRDAFFNETWESGTIPSDNGWTTYTGNPGAQSSDTWVNGSKSLKNGAAGGVYKNTGATGSYNVSWWGRVEGTPASSGVWIYWGVSGGTKAQFGFIANGVGGVCQTNKFCWYTGSAWRSTTYIWSTGTWYEFQLQHYSANTTVVYMVRQNGTGAFTVLDSTTSYNFGAGNKEFTIDNQGGVTSYHDNIYVWNASTAVTPAPAVSTLTLSVVNLVNGTTLCGFCINATGTNATFNQCNNTGNSLVMNTTGTYNITAYNINGSHYNVTYRNYAFTTTNSLSLSTHQSFINVTAKQLFTNNTLLNFSSKNGAIINSTTDGSILLPANVNNNLNVSVRGNYSLNYSVTTTALSVTQFNGTGIYDGLFTILARNGTGGTVTTYNVNATNATLSAQFNSTTNGSIAFTVLQGYYYNFFMNATGYTLANKTLPSNASANSYTFDLLTQNTFELRFYNETTDTLINNPNTTIYVQLISSAYSNNYSTTNGTLTVSLLTPSEYTIRYWNNPDVPRDYYVTLSPQSYQNLSLYIIDEEVSTLYLPKEFDGSGKACSANTISLMRYFVSNNSYKVVEMAKTDTNGQAVIHVVPNIINYKLLFSGSCGTFTSAPQKFTESSNSFTVDDSTTSLTPVLSMDGVSKSLTFVNSTLTFSATWNDASNTVTRGCLQITKTHNGAVNKSYYSSCQSATSGSIIHTITDVNQSNYKATLTLYYNDEVVYGDFLEVSFNNYFRNFGTVGVFLTLMVFLVFCFMGGGRTEAVVLSGIGALFIMGSFGFIYHTWSAFVGIVIVGVMIAYKSRT